MCMQIYCLSIVVRYIVHDFCIVDFWKAFTQIVQDKIVIAKLVEVVVLLLVVIVVEGEREKGNK